MTAVPDRPTGHRPRTSPEDDCALCGELLPLPSLGAWLRMVREHRDLTRPQVQRDVHISAANLKLIEAGSTIPRQPTLDTLIAAYGMTPAQRRHTTELYQPSLPLPPVNELRQRVIDGHGPELSAFESRSLACGFCDPLWNVLAANGNFHTLYPGLDHTEHNLAVWHLHTAANPVGTEPSADPDTVFLVASLRAALGRFRDAARAAQLLRRLCQHQHFLALWQTSVEVAYDRGPHRVHSPDCRGPITAQVTELLDEPGVRSVLAYRPRRSPPQTLSGL
ncbi:helix-turn-helix domain-containing protein [Nocardia nova]|uniref:helix-turn-helix domain-containing protein n=1 Tax=Nocardia nova TaxID=37330 RepID=UPI0033CE7C64